MGIEYEEKLFCFVDIIGFRDLIEESKDSPQRIMQIYKALEHAKKMATLPRKHQFHYLDVDISRCHSHAFSDTVTMSCPFDSFGYLNFIIAWSMTFQRLMWHEKHVFVKGGIALGDVYDRKNNGVVFGPGMISAYDLEEKQAVWPRTVLDSSILHRLGRDDLERAFHEWLIQDSVAPGIYFLDYLTDQFALIASSENRQSRLNCIKLFEDHKNSIAFEVAHVREQSKQIKRSAEERKAILDKYGSLAEYHNSVIERLKQTTLDLIERQELIRDIVRCTMDDACSHLAGNAEFDTKYTADKIEFIDTMLLTGIAVDRIYLRHESELTQKGRPELEAFFCIHIPNLLREMVRSFEQSRIDLQLLLAEPENH